MPLLTRKAWFGPKRLGWGWTPITWEGWVVTLVFLAGIVAAGSFLTHAVRAVALVLVILAFLVVSFVTGGRPGSRLGRGGW